MNRILLSAMLACLCLLPFGKAFGQARVYAGIGFNQSFLQPDSLNYVVQRYNALNSPEKELSEIRSPRGVTANVGLLMGKVMLDIGYTMRIQGARSKESTNANGNYQVRQIQFRMNTLDIGLGFKLNKAEQKIYALGLSADLGAVRVFTRYGQNGQLSNQPLKYPVVNEVNVGTTVFFHGQVPISEDLPFQIFFRPYYHYSFFRNDYGPLNRTVNVPEYQDDPLFLLSPAHNFGLKLGIIFLSK